MRYWDSSALVPLLVLESSSGSIAALLAADRSVTTWWATVVECTSAIARRERDGSLEPQDLERALRRLTELETGWAEVSPSNRLRETARRLVRVHDLCAADAFQLAACVAASDTDEDLLPFVTLDERLALAAQREGFPVLGLS